MSFIDRGDEDFERTLLRSAAGDLPAPEASARAWSRFAALMASVAMTLGTKGVAAPPATVGASRRFADAVAATKWWVAGAIAGSAVTFALVGRHGGAPEPAGSVVPALATPSPSMAIAPPLLQVAPSAWAPRAAPLSLGEASPAARSPVRPLARSGGEVAEVAAPSAKRSAPAAQDEATSLAAEVAALDVARRTLDAGMADDALVLLGRYLRAFPKGKLAPEAQVLRIEALAAKGDRARATGEAVRFLAQYPNAPQRTRVEQLRDEDVAPGP